MDDPAVLALLSCKEPRRYQKNGETYASAQVRWRKRYDAYRDAYCMAWCEVYKNSKLFKAFYGVEMKFVTHV
jgi:hypothetical protein